MLELLRGMGDPVKALVDRHGSRSHACETLVLLALAEERSKEKREPGDRFWGAHQLPAWHVWGWSCLRFILVSH